MIISDCQQGSDEWFLERCGRPTSSCFGKIITPGGKPTSGETRKKYIYQLAGERLMGAKMAGFVNEHMLRGTELEPEAREVYELITGKPITQVGLVYKDERKAFSCSPDGLCANIHGLEIKCPSLPVHTEYLHKGVIPNIYIPQVQGSLYITRLDWWDFMSYFPGMEPLIISVEPDEKYHEKLEVALISFLKELDEVTEALRGKLSKK